MSNSFGTSLLERDLVVDMDANRKVYEGRQGRHPERMSRIRLRAEDAKEIDAA